MLSYFFEPIEKFGNIASVYFVGKSRDVKAIEYTKRAHSVNSCSRPYGNAFVTREHAFFSIIGRAYQRGEDFRRLVLCYLLIGREQKLSVLKIAHYKPDSLGGSDITLKRGRNLLIVVKIGRPKGLIGSNSHTLHRHCHKFCPCDHFVRLEV